MSISRVLLTVVDDLALPDELPQGVVDELVGGQVGVAVAAVEAGPDGLQGGGLAAVVEFRDDEA